MRTWHLAIIVFFTVLLGFLLVAGLQSYHRQLDAHDRYRPVEAVVVVSQVIHLVTYGSTVQIKYNYTVDDQSYQSGRYAFVSRTESADDRAARYPVGASVTAWYDPENPAEAVLNNNETSMPLILTWFIPTPVVALIFWLVYRRKARRFAAANKNGAA